MVLYFVKYQYKTKRKIKCRGSYFNPEEIQSEIHIVHGCLSYQNSIFEKIF